MAVRFGINGFGRIGRCIMRAALARGESLEGGSGNDIDKPSALAHLFKYDSVHRTFPGKVSATEKGLVIDGKEIQVTAEKDPAALPWKALGVDVVLECSGRFTDRASAQKHFSAGARQGRLSAPATQPDITLAYPINPDQS